MEKVLVGIDFNAPRVYSIKISDLLPHSGEGHFRSFKDLVGFKIVGVEEVDEGFILELE
jgi:hypothetical protein